MASALSRRLGKRSLLGALVHTPNPAGDGMLIPGLIQAFRSHPGKGKSSYTVSFEDGRFKECGEDSIIGPGFQSLSSFSLIAGQEVFLTVNGREEVGLVETHNKERNEVQVHVAGLGVRTLRRIEELRLMESRRSPRLQELEREHTRAGPPEHSVGGTSSGIDVPTRKSEGVDEIMAAMVLTSLSCSPSTNSTWTGPPHSSGRGENGKHRCRAGSSWGRNQACNSGSPSPPHLPLSDTNPPEDLTDLPDTHQLLFEEHLPRKRKNSVKIMYKCMWPDCSKLLCSTVGIRRHIRTVHLGRKAEADPSDGEEDFYYTEVQETSEDLPEYSSVPRSLSPPGFFPQNPPGVSPPLPHHEEVSDVPVSAFLSQSAPSCLWQVSADHPYKFSPDRGFTFGDCIFPEMVTPHIVFAASPKVPASHRKVRGEAKKCRKVYGLENRSQWCTACRWKKACQRFHD
ncbi:zinc finger protein 395 isoform X2 [Callorhinchus milii]|nr:zinc finger protein 395 isoform X2 [Callorhinchus milii]